MIHAIQVEDVAAVKYNLAFQLIGIGLDMIMLHHHHHHIDLGEELVEVENLILHNLLLGEEGVEGLEGTGEVALLDVEHLEGGAFAHVIDVLLVGESV